MHAMLFGLYYNYINKQNHSLHAQNRCLGVSGVLFRVFKVSCIVVFNGDMIYYSDKTGVNFYREKKDLLFLGFL